MGGKRLANIHQLLDAYLGFFLFLMTKNLGSFIPSTFCYLLLIFILFVHPDRM